MMPNFFKNSTAATAGVNKIKYRTVLIYLLYQENGFE
jgi:hypothetical protein